MMELSATFKIITTPDVDAGNLAALKRQTNALMEKLIEARLEDARFMKMVIGDKGV